MSFARKCKRRYDRNDRQCRITCPKCHAKLIEKTEYGLVCMECGWMKLSSMYIGEDNDYEQKTRTTA